MTTHPLTEPRFAAAGMGTRTFRRMLMWIMISVLVALLAYFGFRAYLSPEFLFNFANAFHC